MSERFSKAKLRAYCERRTDALDKEFQGETGRPLDPRNGYAQVQGKGETASRIYGEWRALMDMIDRIEGGEL